jgi:hypothetical protein
VRLSSGIGFFVALCAIAAASGIPFQTKSLRVAKEGWWEAEAKYPVFSAHSPVLDFGKAHLEANAHKLIEGFLKDAPTYLVNGAKPDNPFALDSSFSIAYSSKTLLSLNTSTYEDMGGAHPNTQIDTFNFGLVHGRAKKLTLQDLFKQGVKGGPIMNKILMKALRKKNLSFIEDGSIKSLEAKDLDNFVLTPKGFDYLFSAYEVASYAEGPQTVHVNFSQVSGLDRSGPLKGL